MSFDSMKEEMSKKIGQPVLYSWEIKKIIENLGGPYTNISPVKNKLIPREYGINLKIHGIFNSVVLYPQKEIWNYLKQLENKGKIQLKQKGITCFEEILDREYHRITLGHGGSTGRGIKNITPLDGTGGSWDNAVKAYEE
jgi:hypothetical protein